MKHSHKVKLARKMRTQKEIADHTPIFQTKGWDVRKKGIADRVANKQKTK